MTKNDLVEEIDKYLLGMSEQDLSEILNFIKRRQLESGMEFLDKIIKEDDGLMRRLADS